MKNAGHVFLAKLGKTTLRPGGIDATAWLIEQANINKDTKILEVACNMGKTMIQLCERFSCNITGVDIDKDALLQAERNIERHKLKDKLKLVHGDAMALPFENNSFDIVINEAMLTMLKTSDKDMAIREYFRVLRRGGLLLTHDVVFRVESKDTQQNLRENLSKAINVNVEPLDKDEWKNIFERNGFSVSQKIGKMTLMNPFGMIHDEGFFRTLKIIRNARKKENRETFKKMFSFFNKNKNNLGYICTVAKKI